MNIAIQFELQDDQERQAFMRFAEMIEKYRMAKWQTAQVKTEPVPAPDPVTPAVEPAAPPAEAFPDPPVEPAHAPTLAEIQQRFKDYALTHELKKARDLLNEFGINRVPDLPKERYADFMGRMNQIVVSA